VERTRGSAEKFLEKQRCEREETLLRLSELKKEAFEFRRDIVGGAVNARTGKVMAEKVVRFYEQKIAQRRAQMEKLAVKNRALKNQSEKMRTQLRQRGESEMFLPIDFDQLKIENSQYLKQIEERNALLLEHKVSAGATHRALAALKKQLYDLQRSNDAIRKDIKGKEAQLERLRNDAAGADVQHSKALSANKGLKGQLQEFRVPPVTEYVKLTAQLAETNQRIASWERKIEIARMAAKADRRTGSSANTDLALGGTSTARRSRTTTQRLGGGFAVRTPASRR
jgi:chromosome segregation ATPase